MPTIQVAILVRRNYWTTTSRFPFSGNGATHRSVPDIVRALGRAGASATLVEPDFAMTPGSFDALVLPGGDDIHPELYGQPLGAHVHPEAIDLELDRFQLGWARQALRSGTPTLGICRGMQLLNVAAGGDLVQHVEGHVTEQVLADPRLRAEVHHDISTVDGTRVAALLGARVGVNSIHHQSVGRLGEGFRVSAVAGDGVAEAIERAEAPWQRGVQFHPEDLPHLQVLFEALVEDARKSNQRMKGRR